MGRTKERHNSKSCLVSSPSLQTETHHLSLPPLLPLFPLPSPLLPFMLLGSQMSLTAVCGRGEPRTGCPWVSVTCKVELCKVLHQKSAPPPDVSPLTQPSPWLACAAHKSAGPHVPGGPPACAAQICLGERGLFLQWVVVNAETHDWSKCCD